MPTARQIVTLLPLLLLLPPLLQLNYINRTRPSLRNALLDVIDSQKIKTMMPAPAIRVPTVPR